MTAPNDQSKGRRQYASVVRARQAEQTRAAIVSAASDCFAERGYRGTTMKDIATRAGVAVETVYAHGNKVSLLTAAVDRVRAGDADAEHLVERSDMRAVLEAASPRDALRQLATLIADSLPAALPVLAAFRQAADSDPKIAEAYEAYEGKRWLDLRPITDALAPGLRAGVRVDEAADTVWSLLDPTAAEGLVRRRGWTVAQWAEWVVTALERMLLDDSAGRR